MRAYYIKMPGLTSIDSELHMGVSSMATTEAGAWKRHIGIKEGTEIAWEPREISRRIQAWFDKGYRVVEVEITSLPKPDRNKEYEDARKAEANGRAENEMASWVGQRLP